MVRRLARVLGLFLVGLGTTLVAAEVLTRLLTDIHPPLTVRDARIGQRYLESFSTEIFVPESGRDVALRFNREGFRGPDLPFERESGDCRIAVLGDSQIAAIATREEDTLVRRLESILRASAPEVNWEVMNFGVSGASTAQEIVLYREVVRAYAPDLVIGAYFEGNDFTDNSRRLSWSPRVYMDLDEEGRLFELPLSGSRAGASAWLNRHSRFYVWQKVMLNQARANIIDRGGVFELRGGDLTFSTREDEDLAQGWELTKALLRRLRDDVAADDRLFLLVYLPVAETLYPDLWRAKFSEPPFDLQTFDAAHARTRIEAMIQEHSIETLFLQADFREEIGGRSGADSDAWLYFHGVAHLNEKGQDLAARAIFERLKATGALADLIEGCDPVLIG